MKVPTMKKQKKFRLVFTCVIRILNIAAIALMLCTFYPFAAKAADEALLTEQYNAAGAEDLEVAAGVQEFIEDFQFADTAMQMATGKSGFDLNNIMSRIWKIFTQELAIGIKQGAAIILIVMAVGILSKFMPEGSDVMEVAFYVGYAALLIMSLTIFRGAAQIGVDAVSDMSIFIKCSLPVMVTLSSASGGVMSIPAAATVGFLTYFLSYILNTIALPLCFICAALAAVNNISPELSFKGLSGAIKKTLTWGMGFLMTLFTILLTAQGLAGAGLKNAGGKAAKFMVGSVIPVVGSMLAESIEAVISCSSMIRGVVGGAGIIALVYICIVPILKMGAISLIFFIISAVISPIADTRLCNVIDEFSSLMGIVTAIVAAVGVMFVISMGLLVLV